MAYNYMGQMQWNIGDSYGAQQSLTGAIRTLDPGNPKHRQHLGYAYNLLGNVSLNLKQYDEAINFYNNSMAFFKDSIFALEVMNGKATALQKKRNYKEAIAVYDSILSLSPADQLLVARIIDNRARTKWLQDPGYAVLPDFKSALKLRADNQSSLGLNTSYGHLADYYSISNPDSALWYAQKMHESASENANQDDRLESIDKLIRFSSSPTLKEHWYEEYKILNDSVQLSRDTTRNRFALIRYDVQKSKADNLVLQQHITRQELLMIGLSGLAAAIIIAISFWFAKRRKRIKQEAENEIRNARLKTSQKVHDVVANGLYGIMNELEHVNQIEREPLLNKIEGLYEKSRNISYEAAEPTVSIDYDNQVHHLLTSFASEKTKVIVVGNQPAFWSSITEFQKQELQLILQEMMINMKKHSEAKNVAVVFKQDNSKAIIQYKDDGVGMTDDAKLGNGLNNTVNRIKSLRGEVTFEKNGLAGVAILISLPLETSKA